MSKEEGKNTMMNHRHFGPQFEQREWNGPRSFRGHGRPEFGHRGGSRRDFRRHFQQPSPEQQVLRSTALEVARLFAITARTSYGNTEKQAQLRHFLENARTELTTLITNTQENTEATPSENAPEVAQSSC